MKNQFFKTIFRMLGLVLVATLAISFAGLDDNASAKRRKVYKGRKYVTLTIGLTKDLKVPYLPKKATFKGTFKKYTKVGLDKSTKTLRFDPVRTGNGTLTIYDSRKRKIEEIFITVQKSDLKKVAREVSGLLGDIEGIEIKIVNRKVIVDGQILLPRDLDRIASVVTQYDGLVASIVSLSPLAQKKIAEFIERDINNPEIHCRAVNGTFILEGVANDKSEKERAEIIAKTYVPDAIIGAGETLGVKKVIQKKPVVNLLTLKPVPEAEPGKIIQLVVHYVELKKDYTKGFRFQWTPSLTDNSSVQFNAGGRGAASGVVSALTGTIDRLLPKLNWAKQHGHARILKSSSVIVQENQTGKLQSSMRVPYQIIGQNGQASTSFEEVGMSTEIKPQIIGSKSDSIQLKVDFKIKDLLGLSAKGPLVSNNAINTTIVVRSGQSAAIGGLVSNETQRDYNKLPKNAPANPLISLYASKSFRRDQSQFVVFITPVIKSSASSGAERIKAKFRLRD